MQQTASSTKFLNSLAFKIILSIWHIHSTQKISLAKRTPADVNVYEDNFRDITVTSAEVTSAEVTSASFQLIDDHPTRSS